MDNIYIPDDGQFSFYKRPISNTEPYRAVGLIDIYHYIKGNCAKARTEKLRSITDKRERKQYKANKFDYCTFSGIFSQCGEKNFLHTTDNQNYHFSDGQSDNGKMGKW